MLFQDADGMTSDDGEEKEEMPDMASPVAGDDASDDSSSDDSAADDEEVAA